MRRARAILKWLLLVIVIGVAVGSAGGYVYLRRSLPQLSGTVQVPGLQAPVEIVRDADAVPHIYAQTKLDAFYGLGYVHAQDRLWEMEIWRRVTQGRFAEIFGAQAIENDNFLRTLGLLRAGRSAWSTFPAEHKPAVEAYSAGVNAFLATHSGSQLPPEFTALGIQPEPWTPVDSVAWAKIFALDLSSNLGSELFGSELVRAVGVERMQQLMPGYPEDGVTILADLAASSTPSDRASAVASPYERLIAITTSIEAMTGVGGFHGGAKGSNSWVVDGTKSTTGKPILANDPHLTMTLPGWYQAHMAWGEHDVIGATIPGLPGVVIGRNRDISWGFTGLNPDVQDLYRERLDPSGTLAEFRGQLEPLQLITETIKVRGQADVTRTLRITRHGPLISDAINASDFGPTMPATLQPAAELEPLALRWTALDPGDTTVAAILEINEARGWDDALGALRLLSAPGLSFLYADIHGNIGYYAAAGKVPIRARGNGALPVEGWTGENEWIGWVPFEELPHAFNPPEHFIATANNRPVTDDYPYFLGREWYPHYRAQRITDLLQAKDKLSPEDMAAIQHDTVSLQARELLPTLLRLIDSAQPPLSGAEASAVELLRQWDHDTRGDSAAAAIYQVWFASLPRAIVGDELQRQRRIIDYEGSFSFVSRFLPRTLSDRSSAWCDNTTTAATEDCATIARQTLRSSVEFLQQKQGADPRAWRWDKLHVSIFYHVPFHDVPLLRPIFSRSLPTGGDWSTVNMGAYPSFRRLDDQRFENYREFEHRFGPSYRQIVDLASLDGGRFIQTVGQSGHFLSPSYDLYLEDWGAGRYRPMRMQRATVTSGASTTLRLEP